MARLARLYAPNTSQLVQSRLLPQVATLPEMRTLRTQLLLWLEQASARYCLPIHAWSVTSESIYLLCTPDEPRSVSQVVQALGRHLASNLKQGAVFASRYRSCLLEDSYFLSSMMWIEMDVHQAEGVENPALLPWSSAGVHTGAWHKDVPWLKDHEAYWQLGNTPFERQAKYRELCENGLSVSIRDKIQATLQGQWALGSPAFIEEMTAVASRRVVPGQKGRPRKGKD